MVQAFISHLFLAFLFAFPSSCQGWLLPRPHHYKFRATPHASSSSSPSSPPSPSSTVTSSPPPPQGTTDEAPPSQASSTAPLAKGLPEPLVKEQPRPWPQTKGPPHLYTLLADGSHDFLEGDVVEYLLTPREQSEFQDGRKLGLGVVTREGKVHPLCIREMGSSLHYYDEDQEELPEEASMIVTRVLEEGIWFSQRIIEDRVRNPHGEEAEDVFIIEASLSPGCGPVLRLGEKDEPPLIRYNY